MRVYNFIFGESRVAILKRHFLFWTVIYLVMLGSYFHDGLDIIGFRNWMSLQSLECVLHLVTQMLFCYAVVYGLMPRLFMKKKYFLFGIAVLLVFIVVYFIHYLSNDYLFRRIHYHFGLKFRKDFVVYWLSFISMVTYLPLTFGLVVGIKSFKTWYKKQLNQKELIRWNANAELQLLKAQVHPHFLFNTLNNIYSFILTNASGASSLISKLSGMLRYMLTDCQQPYVRLQDEINLLQDYIGLEQVRYGERLVLEVDIKGDIGEKLVAPLLMIPFIENAFKHGASRMITYSFIHLKIVLVGNELIFELSNNMPVIAANTTTRQGIGLTNVKKRLALLYPGEHELLIESLPDRFVVRMQLRLRDDAETGVRPGSTSISSVMPAYAAY
ncbi:MAG TPA: histidine kinase [Chryseolinea sp.]|nr:histidine kinase [Chryseolinea sp.]